MEFHVFENPANVHPTKGYSHAVRMGDLIFASGQVAQSVDGEIVGKGDPRAQAEQIFINLEAVLMAAGSGLNRIGKLNILTTSLDYLPAIREVRDRLFGPLNHTPASTLAVISSLAHPDYLIEIEAIAAAG